MRDRIVSPFYTEKFKEALQKEGKSSGTILSYLRTVQDFNKINREANKEFNLKELTQDNIKRYVETMKDNGCSLATIRTRLSALGSFFCFFTD